MLMTPLHTVWEKLRGGSRPFEYNSKGAQQMVFAEQVNH